VVALHEAEGFRSHLLVGTVRHRRARKTDYDFTHHAWYLALDLDEVDMVADRLRFNPASFILCHDSSGTLRHVIAEVHNTHGERIAYDVPSEYAGPVYSGSVHKQLYVSPFIGESARYHIRVSEQGNRLQLSIHEYEDDELTLFARVSLERRPVSDRLKLRGLPWDRFRPRSEYTSDDRSGSKK
jgi:DUF1365 family protein